jgi:hypothetical protein
VKLGKERWHGKRAAFSRDVSKLFTLLLEMTTTEKIAIAGSICTAVPSITLLIKAWFEHKRSIYKEESAKRRGAISGHWVGTVYQAKGPGDGPIQFKINFHLRADGIKVKGNASFVWEKSIEVEIDGGYIDIDENFLKLEYKDAMHEVLRYGTIIFHLSPDARTLEGRFVGYAPEPRKLIYGRIAASKACGEPTLKG